MKVYVHIGHGKTGSSYLQTCLALNMGKLRDLGVQYPINPSRAEKAKSGHVTIGNFSPFQRHQSLKDFIMQQRTSMDEDILISSEQLASPKAYEQLADLESIEGVDRVIVLLFIRNPLDHVISFYQQYVRGQGETKPIEEYFQTYSYPNHVNKVIMLCLDHGYDVRIRNYSFHENNIWTEFLRMMDLDPEQFSVPEIPTVHRGMRNIELECARLLNERGLATQAKEMSNYLSQTYPASHPEHPYVEPSVLRDFLKRMDTLTEKVNNILPVAERYGVPTFEEVEVDYCQDRNFSPSNLRSELAPIIEFFVNRNEQHRSEGAVWQVDSCLKSAQQKLRIGDYEQSRHFLDTAKKAFEGITRNVKGVDRVNSKFNEIEAALKKAEK